MDYKILPYTRKQAKLIGVEVKPSAKKDKKIDVYKNNKLIASVGAKGYLDYPSYLQQDGKKIADEHKKLYLERHRKREDWSKNGIDTPGFWSRWLLWNKPTLEKSLEYILDKYKLIV